MTDLRWLDGVGTAELIRAGELKPREAAEAAIARIEDGNPALNAVVTSAFEQGLEVADGVDLTAPLAGVPFLIKDQQDWAGVRTTHGSEFLRDYVPTTTTPICERWLNAGVVPLGKTNVPEFGLLATTEPQAYGPSRNPWDPTRTTGGSSGGSAAAVASGMVPVASASDGGGSIRIPAAACGLVGLKTTRGRNPGIGWGGLGVVHVLARSVRDTAAFLDASCGPLPGDAIPMPRPERAFLDAAAAPPARLRIAMSTEMWLGVRVAPNVIEAVERTAALLAELGHEVVEGRPALTEQDLGDLFPRLDRIMPAAVARNLDQFALLSGQEVDLDRIEPVSRLIVEMGRKVTAMEYLEALEAQTQLVAKVRPFFDTNDVWLLPTTAEVAPPIGAWVFPPDDPLHGALRMTMFVPPLMTSLANQTGQPAISLPLEQDATTGMPIGMQLYGRFGDEATLLQLATQLEAAQPWADRHPSVS